MQIIDVYLRSHINHIYLNDLYKKSGKSEYRRVLLEPSRFKGNRVLVFLLCIAYWLLMPFFFGGKVIKAIITKKKYSYSNKIYKKYFLLSMNESLPRIVKNAKIPTAESAWIVKDEPYNEDMNYISYFRYLNLKDLFCLYFVSLVAYYKSVFRYGMQVSILAAEAYEFMLRYRGCSCFPIESDYYFCNHMDRNAVLIDNLPQGNKYLIQHGTMIMRSLRIGLSSDDMVCDNEKSIWTYNIPYKYNSIKKVYCFSEKEYLALCMSILHNRPCYEVVGYSLKTTPINDMRKSVLIIGYYSNYAEKEERLISKLQNYNIKLFLKNHPCQAGKWYQEMINKYNFEFIDAPYFPAVNYVVSYESTLALEYESVGSKVFYYDEYTIDQIVERILMD